MSVRTLGIVTKAFDPNRTVQDVSAAHQALEKLVAEHDQLRQAMDTILWTVLSTAPKGDNQ